MPYSDLSDAWNSYDPRYNRVSQQVFPTDEGEGEPPPQPDQRRLNAFLDWRNKATPDELRDEGVYRPFPLPFSRAPEPPGYEEGSILPLPPSRDAGFDALRQERESVADQPRREEALSNALQRSRAGIPRINTIQDQYNAFLGEPIADVRGAAPSPDDENDQSWLDVYNKYINSISNIGAPPRDQVILAPGQSEGGRFGTHPLADQAAGIYLYDQQRQAKPPPAGDVVLPSTSSQPGELYTNPTQSTVWPSVARRMRDDINQQYNSGALADEEAGRGWARGKYDMDLMLQELEQRAKGDGPSWLRRIGYDGAPIGAAPSPDAPQIQGPTRPGFNDPSVLARVYKDIQRDLRLTPDQALGFLSNLNAESFGFAKPQEVGPQIKGRNTGGLGWGQWTAGRRGSFEDYLKQTGTTPTSYEGNYGFLLSELQKPEWQPFLENLRKQRDAESATRYTEKGYENPSRKTGRQDWLARTRRELPASQNALGQVRGSAPPAPNSLETARPYTPLPPNYLRRQPFATGSSQLYQENLLF